MSDQRAKRLTALQVKMANAAAMTFLTLMGPQNTLHQPELINCNAAPNNPEGEPKDEEVELHG